MQMKIGAVLHVNIYRKHLYLLPLGEAQGLPPMPSFRV